MRASKSNKNDYSGTTISACPPTVRHKDSEIKFVMEPSNNCSKGRRKPRRFAVSSDKLGSNCLEEGKIGHVSKQCQPTICQNASEKDANFPLNKRRPKRVGNQLGEITRRDSMSKYVEESGGSPIGKKRKREGVERDAPIKFAIGEHNGGLHVWTEEQEIALREAYFSARPSPHFWKKVSKMVPGKNAQECFNRIQLNFTTPPLVPPKSRLKGNQTDSTFRKLNLLEPNYLKDQISAEPKTRRAKQKQIRDDQKALRHLLKKQRFVDQVKNADYFSQFETSPVILPSDVKLPSDFSCNERLNSVLENIMKPGTSQSQPDLSPAVSKQVKNMKLHEKYIDHLHSVDARRKACIRTCSTKRKKVDLGPQAGLISDAKTVLASEAQDFIGCFKKLQADPFGDCALSDDDNEDVF